MMLCEKGSNVFLPDFNAMITFVALVEEDESNA